MSRDKFAARLEFASPDLDSRFQPRPNCNWIMGAFEKRAEARAKEEEGLFQAKSLLAGADLGFLQHVQ